MVVFGGWCSVKAREQAVLSRHSHRLSAVAPTAWALPAQRFELNLYELKITGDRVQRGRGGTSVRRQQRGGRRREHEGCEEVAIWGEVLEFMRSIWGISHGLQSTSKKMEAEMGITGPQRLVVRILGRCPGASAGQLAKILHLHPSTLTGVLRRLETRGIVRRTPGPRDRREARLRLTPAGRAIDRRRAGTVEDAVRGVLRALPQSKIDTTAEVLRVLEDALTETGTDRKRSSARAR
jgi:DNA-binding MarR family transcriptional regulator